MSTRTWTYSLFPAVASLQRFRRRQKEKWKPPEAKLFSLWGRKKIKAWEAKVTRGTSEEASWNPYQSIPGWRKYNAILFPNCVRTCIFTDLKCISPLSTPTICKARWKIYSQPECGFLCLEDLCHSMELRLVIQIDGLRDIFRPTPQCQCRHTP